MDTQNIESSVAACRIAASYTRSRSAPSADAWAAAIVANPTASPTERESTTRTVPENFSAANRAAPHVPESFREMCTATTPAPLLASTASSNTSPSSCGLAPEVLTPGVVTRFPGTSSTPSTLRCSGTVRIP